MIIRRWGSLLLTTALWISFGILLKRCDFDLYGEAKAFLTVLFGLATSFLIFNFIWLMQKKPLHDSWTGLHTGDTPSMHPRGRADSFESIGTNHRRPTVCTVASIVDRPPNYEDALINSKPINWTYLPVDKTINNCGSSNFVGEAQQSSGESRTHMTSDNCCICMDDLPQNKVNHKTSSTNSVTQLALNIVRGFTALDSNHSNQQQFSLNPTTAQTQNLRKISYSQLDANQLMISGSPPKYKELVFSGLIDEAISNNSNEPIAGERV